MKIKPRLYAQALAQVLSHTTTQAQAQQITRNFAQVLQRHHQLRDWPKIARLLAPFYEQATRELTVQITSATPLTPTQNTATLAWLTQQFATYQLTPHYDLDPHLLGGLTIQIQHTLYDLSLKNQLHHFLKS